MRKQLAAIALAAAAIALIVIAPAMAGSPDNDYQGRAERDSVTYFGFDLKHKNGKTKVTRVFAVLKYHCAGESGSGNETIGAVADGSLTVKPNKRFSGTLEVPPKNRGGSSDRFIYKIKGKLGKNGKASGTIDADARFSDARGTVPTHCYSGGLSWRAKKGATVNPPEGRPLAKGFGR